MDSLSQLLTLLAPQCVINLHCRFRGRWDASHPQLLPGVVPWHIILQGNARLLVAGKTIETQAGDILLLPQGSPHLLQSQLEWGHMIPAIKQHNGILTEVRTEGPGPAVEVLCGEFHFGANAGWLFAEDTELIHLQTDARKDFPELETLLVMLIRESLSGLPGSAMIVKGLADTLLALILRILLSLREPPNGILRLMREKRLLPALAAVIADPASDWTMENMAERCFLSRASFARHFARSYHQTPQAWLSQLRLASASRLLALENDLPVGMIAERCGFSSPSSFTKAFKKLYGMTPAHYRKMTPR